MFFFFQAEDGIRDTSVTGVQTCALPIYRRLTPHGRRVGLISDAAWADFLAKQERMESMKQLLEKTRSEERRVGKECRSRWWAEQWRDKEEEYIKAVGKRWI